MSKSVMWFIFSLMGGLSGILIALPSWVDLATPKTFGGILAVFASVGLAALKVTVGNGDTK